MKRKIIFSFYIVQIFNFFSQTASCNLILRQKSISKKKKKTIHCLCMNNVKLNTCI